MTSEDPELLMMSAFLKAAAFDAMRDHALAFRGDFLEQLGDFIETGVKQVAREANAESIWANSEIVNDNLNEFMIRVIGEVREAGKYEVTPDSLAVAMAGFCPRWPFCR
jgi:hypothetical protein